MSRPRESDKCLHVRAIFGLWHAQSRAETTRLHRLATATARRILTSLSPGQIALITGPSGCGKSTLLRAIAAASRSKRCTVIANEAMLDHDDRAMPAQRRAAAPARTVDLFDLPMHDTLRILAAAGLAEARVFTAVATELSQGQRDRLRLALALARAESGAARQPILILDEFACSLDRTTAHSVAAALRRWTTTTGTARIVCATSHDDVRESLRPEFHIELSLMGLPRVNSTSARRASRGRRGR